MRSFICFFFSAVILTAQDQIDLVQFGHETFHTLGCAECHSEIKNDDSIKTGPGLHGLFQKTTRKREVLAGGEGHRQMIAADLAYFTQSIRKPNEDLAVTENGEKQGESYLPVMPPYNEETLSEFQAKAIYQYLLTLNDESQRGPAEVMAQVPQTNQEKSALDDPNEILVTDKTRIYRTRIKGQSARAIYVGTPRGINYCFDPISLSFERIWFGGFLNLKGSLDGRGQKPSQLGHQAKEVPLQAPLLAPLHPETGLPIDLSFKSPRFNDFKTIARNLHNDANFAEQLAQAGGRFLGYEHRENPIFHFAVGQNTFRLELTISAAGNAKLTLNGELAEPQTFRLAPLIKGQQEDWEVTSLPTELTFVIPTQSAWRPSQAKNSPSQQSLKKTPANSIRLPKGFKAEQIAAPSDPHGREQLFEPLGIVNGPDNSLIVASRTAGIWSLKNNTWTQIAEGFQDCLGIILEENGDLIVGQKPEVTRLVDTDNDGRYDFYQTLSEAFLSTSNYHEYLHGPVKGRNGNYYFSLNLAHHNTTNAIHKAEGKYMGAQGGYRGWALEVTPEGQTSTFASGLRSPAGLATGPDGELYYTENQGEYVGTSKLYLLEKDKYYGHPAGLVDLPGMKPESPEIHWEAVSSGKEKALALMPHSFLANAPGSPTWMPGAKSTELFVGDQTLSALFEIRLHPDNEAALLPFADKFPSGLMRLNFTPDKQLYIGQTGRGWRAQGDNEDALIVVSSTDEPADNRVKDITREGKTFTLHFSQALSTTPSGSELKLKSWTYLDSPKYGSPEQNQIEHKIVSIKKDDSGTKLLIEFESNAAGKNNRVFHFTSSQLPHTKGDIFEAFYSICRK